ncbi:MAG TPA: hypothetical protein DD638_03580 [Pasteurellaceae bacterium]|nr:hypothetical protein [Pasteurellaceae bacterium]
MLPKQEALREQIKQAKTKEEKTALYNEIYELQYTKRLLETTVGIISGSPNTAITQGTLQLAATKLREVSLESSRRFDGIIDEKTGIIIRNDSYDSSYFDGVKLGGVRIDVNMICDEGRCVDNQDGTYTYIGSRDYPSLVDIINPELNKIASDLYGETGGFQPTQGMWKLNSIKIPYKVGSFSDKLIESFAGTHDYLGGQIWGWYDEKGNTAKKNLFQEKASMVTTVVAIPVSAPFALADLVSPDLFEVLTKIGGQ